MHFEDLEVWKRSARLCADIYKGMASLKDYGFKDQITRSALSIASNIAEGYERDSDKDRARFISYAKASCAELRTQIYIGIEINYINREQGKVWVEETKQLSKMTYALMKKINA
ncbi:four helix bundle protein [Oceanisphaera arctica]|uniref:Four helix bundle protein n=1 Tax=Oceanisphaera arctica TaxID=641510 RepID=A0A2P5TJ15_9GAMM|nr:four helix bundle protein [Oceanisphaera arctica]PPL14813.1 four helix bundle protein [Oceanisphaera arctica]GHA22945.1 four helix bundle protein [Oceanisphaera arctica]